MDTADAQLLNTFHRSILLTSACAGIILCNAEGTWFPGGLTPLVAVLAWLLTTRWPRLQLPLLAANGLGLLALSAAAWEFMTGNIESKLLSGAHLIVYLSWIVLLLRKSNRQYWSVIALSLLQLAVAAVLTSSPGFGASLIGMLAVLLWTLSVFSLYRVRLRHAAALHGDVPQTFSTPVAAGGLSYRRITAINGLQREPNEPWINRSFRGMVAFSFLVSLVLSIIVFAAFPRVWASDSPFAPGNLPGSERGGIASRTGFTDNVRLGEIGSIMQSHGRVLQFSITRLSDGQPVTAEAFAEAMDMDELRFRGNAMGTYRDGEWSRGLEERGYRRGEEELDHYGELVRLEPAYRVEITQDPPVSRFAFAVFPITSAKAAPGSGRVFQRSATGALVWGSTTPISPQAPRSFSFECPAIAEHPEATFDQWMIPRLISRIVQQRMLQRLRVFAEHMFRSNDLSETLPQLYDLTQQICSDNAGPLTARQRADRILQYLSPQNGFQYSLTLTVQDETLDPVEDFLLNTKSGHCEYFASACTLMLQAAGIPARLVNGFYGSEVNTVTGKYEVKQHHAHTWVEAYIDDRWETLEPTPAAERQEIVQSGQSGTLLTDLQSAFSDLWAGGIHNMTLERQRALFDPVLQFGSSMKERVRQQGLWATLKSIVQTWLTSPEAWFSWQGGLLTFVLLLSGTGLYYLHPLRRLRAWLRRLLQRLRPGPDAAGSVIRFYVRFCRMCETHGLSFAAAATAYENAELAAQHFAGRVTDEQLKSLPFRIAAAFNAVRFGAQQLSDEQLQRINSDLEAFSAALQQPHTSAAAS